MKEEIMHKMIAALLLIPLSACATFDGRPKPIIGVKTADAIVAQYNPDKTINNMASIPASDIAGRNSYRDRVIAVYLTAIDAHYGEFVRNLSRSGKGTHIGIDSALLLLTGAGAIFDKAASDLAAGATAVGGVRGSIDRELFADKTITILTSLMDSRRLAVRADIIRSQSKPESVYTLESAYADLMLYEAAGTIDGALADVAADAGVRAKGAQYDFAKAKDLCVVSSSTDDKRRALMLSLEKFEHEARKAKDGAAATQERSQIQKAAAILGMTSEPVPTDEPSAFVLLGKIRNQVEAQCSDEGIDSLRQKIIAGGVTLQ